MLCSRGKQGREMPYRIADDGLTVEHKVNGRWERKQKAKSHEAAIRAMRLLYAIEKDSGFKPRNK